MIDVVVVCEERETFEAACAVVISERAHRPTSWLERDGVDAWRIQLDGAAGIVGRLASGRWIAAVVRVAVLALTLSACGESARPVVTPAPVAMVAPAPVVEEEPEPAAWRCVREGRCAAPRDIDGGVLR